MQTERESATSVLIRELPTLSRDRLAELWLENFDRPAAKELRKELMLPVLAFRIQERVYGGLKPEVRDRLREIAATLRPENRKPGRSQLKPGTRLLREWKGETHEVILAKDGYLYRGEQYKSLSQIASKITGTHWSGPAFFGTRPKRPKA